MLGLRYSGAYTLVVLQTLTWFGIYFARDVQFQNQWQLVRPLKTWCGGRVGRWVGLRPVFCRNWTEARPCHPWALAYAYATWWNRFQKISQVVENLLRSWSGRHKLEVVVKNCMVHSTFCLFCFIIVYCLSFYFFHWDINIFHYIHLLQLHSIPWSSITYYKTVD